MLGDSVDANRDSLQGSRASEEGPEEGGRRGMGALVSERSSERGGVSGARWLVWSRRLTFLTKPFSARTKEADRRTMTQTITNC